MKSIRIFTKTVVILGIMLVMTVSQTPARVSAQETTILLFDDFNGDTLDNNLWTFHSNSSGAAYAISGGFLQVTSGYTPGGGGIVQSISSFNVNPDILVFEIRAKTSNRDGGNFGFIDTSRVGRVFFAHSSYWPTITGLESVVHQAATNAYTTVDLSYISSEDFHVYRIEYSGNSAQYYVDNVLVSTMLEGVAIMPMILNMDRVSWGNEEVLTVDYVSLYRLSATPQYNFSGFFQPIDNLPVLNVVKAGRAIPVKFSIGGDQGMDIFGIGYPKSQEIACDSSALLDGIEETMTAGASSLSYDPATNEYSYVWKTDAGWTNTCRQLIVKLNDGSLHRVNFKFK